MTRRWLYAVGFAALIAIAPIAPAAAQTGAGDGAKAHAAIKDAQGKSVGNATLTQMAHGVLISAELSGLPPGQHGMHIHAVAKCEPPAFTSAGPHFNPTGHKHGYNADAGPHMGDMPNLIVASDGKATVDAFIPDLSLGASQVASGTSAPDKAAAGSRPIAAHNVFDQGGAALVIHAKADDYATDPAGNSGDRIACGVIER